MMRMWQSGAEVNTLTGDVGEFGTNTTATFATLDSSVKRNGTYSVKFTGASQVATPSGLNIPGGTARGYYRLAGTPSTAGRILIFKDSGGGDYCSIQLRTDRKLDLQYNTGAGTIVIGTSGTTVATGDFEQRIELWLDVAARTIAGRLNGITFASALVTDTFSASGNIDHVRFGPNGYTAGVDIWVDDMAVNSFAGLRNCGWCDTSDGVLTYWPTQDSGEVGTWVSQAGGSLFAQLDETAPDDSTSYIKETTGTIDTAYGFYFPQLDRRGPLYAMLIGLRGGGTSAVDRFVRLDFHDPADQSTNGIGTTRNLGLNGWITYYPASTFEKAFDASDRTLTNAYLYPTGWPGYLAPGSKSRAVLVRRDASANETRVSTMWLTVDHAIPVTANAVSVPTPQTSFLVTTDP